MAEGLERAIIRKSRDAADIFMPMLQDKNYECFCVMYLNQASKVIAIEEISSGGLTGTVADIRIILKNALLYNANQLMIAHNHPSGNRTPSAQDKAIPIKISDAAAMMDIQYHETSFSRYSNSGACHVVSNFAMVLF